MTARVLIQLRYLRVLAYFDLKSQVLVYQNNYIPVSGKLIGTGKPNSALFFIARWHSVWTTGTVFIRLSAVGVQNKVPLHSCRFDTGGGPKFRDPVGRQMAASTAVRV